VRKTARLKLREHSSLLGFKNTGAKKDSKEGTGTLNAGKVVGGERIDFATYLGQKKIWCNNQSGQGIVRVKHVTGEGEVTTVDEKLGLFRWIRG